MSQPYYYTCDGEAAERLSDLHAPLVRVRGSRSDVADGEADDAEDEEGDPGEAEEGDPRPEESPEEQMQRTTYRYVKTSKNRLRDPKAKCIYHIFTKASVQLSRVRRNGTNVDEECEQQWGHAS